MGEGEGEGEGDSRASLAKAKKELEDLYLGVPDESVNLTFQDFAQVSSRQQNNNKNKLSPISSPIIEEKSPLSKLPSLDFSKGLEEASSYSNSYPTHHHHHHHHDQRSMAAYDDMSVAYGVERGGTGRRRPGIPHSNICAICCNYIYIYRHRCLVCGRVYCRQCVSDGMGEMSQGRKCIDCLGRRFSQRYIHKAGNVGCCMGYPSMVRQQELKWAERGARRSGESRYGNSVMARPRSPMGPVGPRSRSPVGPGPGTPSRQASTEPPSFVLNSPYSPYSPTNHHPMPF